MYLAVVNINITSSSSLAVLPLLHEMQEGNLMKIGIWGGVIFPGVRGVGMAVEYFIDGDS